MLVIGELAVAFLSIMVGIWTVEQTRQEAHGGGVKVCQDFSHYGPTYSALLESTSWVPGGGPGAKAQVWKDRDPEWMEVCCKGGSTPHQLWIRSEQAMLFAQTRRDSWLARNLS